MDKQQAIQLLSQIDSTTGVLPPELMPKNKRREREHLGHLADAILQQSAAQNSK